MMLNQSKTSTNVAMVDSVVKDEDEKDFGILKRKHADDSDNNGENDRPGNLWCFLSPMDSLCLFGLVSR